VPLERRSLNELATLDVLGLERLAHLAEPLLLGAQLSAGRRAALGDGGCGRFLPRGSKLDNGPQFTARDFKEFIRIAGMTMGSGPDRALHALFSRCVKSNRFFSISPE
jgi:hypothetical protein